MEPNRYDIISIISVSRRRRMLSTFNKGNVFLVVTQIIGVNGTDVIRA